MSKKKYYVYKVTNKINNKIYIGKTNDIKARWKKHIYIAKVGVKSNSRDYQYLHRSINKYGIENFVIEMIEELLTEEEAFEREVFWIKELRSKNRKNGMNLTNGGEGLSGWIPSEEFRLKMSKIVKSQNRKLSKEAKEKLKSIHTGKVVSKETKEKISAAARKRFDDPVLGKELRKKMSKSLKGINAGKNHPQYGKKLSKEAKQHLRLLNQGSKSPKAKLTEKDVLEIRKKYASGNYTTRELAKMYKVGKSTMHAAIKGINWGHI